MYIYTLSLLISNCLKSNLFFSLSPPSTNVKHRSVDEFIVFPPLPLLGGVARALRRRRRHRQVSAAAPGGQHALRDGEGRLRGAPDEPHAAAGGVDAERLQGGGREGGPAGERGQDAAGCEFIEQSVFASANRLVYLQQFADHRSDILRPQLLAEYDSLRNEHERLKVAELIPNHRVTI